VGDTAGASAADDPDAFAAGVSGLLAGDLQAGRAAARSRAERYDWPTSVDAMLATLCR
jgi:alpha-1,6-mannosyltransferase